MDAGLDSLCTAVYVTADDLLPSVAANARRAIDDAAVVALAVAQVGMGIPSNRRFLAVARGRLAHLSPRLPSQPTYFKRRRALRESIDWLAGVLRVAARAPTSSGASSRPSSRCYARPRPTSPPSFERLPRTVNGTRELVARLFLEQYAPRLASGAKLGSTAVRARARVTRCRLILAGPVSPGRRTSRRW